MTATFAAGGFIPSPGAVAAIPLWEGEQILRPNPGGPPTPVAVVRDGRLVPIEPDPQDETPELPPPPERRYSPGHRGDQAAVGES